MLRDGDLLGRVIDTFVLSQLHFRAGLVLHSGPRPFRLDERIHALPIAAIWGPR